MAYIFCAYRAWAIDLYKLLSKRYKSMILLSNPKRLTLNYVKKIDIVDQNLRIKVEKGENVLATILEFINSKGIVVTSVSLAKASLDQVFLKYTGKSLRDAESDKADRFKMYFTRRSRTR